MRTRTALAATFVLVTAVGSVAPAFAASGVVKGSWTFTASPNPTGDNPAGGGKCNPTGGAGRATQEFTVPGPGTLEVSLHNQLDWSGDVRTKDGDVVGDADGSGPTDLEVMSVSFKKKTAVTVGACNLEGEPSVTATYTFTPKTKKK